MNIAFKSENGCCPMWEHDGITYFLYEDVDGTWTLKSRKHGCVTKKRFCKTRYGHRMNPETLLARYFKDKKNVKHHSHLQYTFYYWNGKQYATDGEYITVKYEIQYERPSFDSYNDCLNDAKEYLKEKYSDGQMNLFEMVM